MRQVVGKSIRDLDAAAFAERRAAYRRTVLDLGTGDGKHVLDLARAHPDTFVVGLDAARDAMLRNSQPKRTPKNAIFVWAAVEQLPTELTDVDEVHILMPWGSLLRAVVEPDRDVLATIARACAAGAGFEIALNLQAWRPPVPEVGATVEPTPESATTALAAAGWQVTEARYGVTEGTSWAKRLGRDALTLHGVIR